MTNWESACVYIAMCYLWHGPAKKDQKEYSGGVYLLGMLLKIIIGGYAVQLIVALIERQLP